MRRAFKGRGSVRFDPRRLRTACASAVAALLIGGAAPAVADEQPSILKAYGLDWIERVRDDAWPQPKEQRPIICLLDTGVAITPDTPADDPLGPIVARLAIDGGTGLPQGDLFEHTHGTQMASIIAAPRNGYGTVGVFPQARIVSVRVTEGDATYITPGAMVKGVASCTNWAIQHEVAMATVSMSESNYDQREADAPLWQYAARRAVALGAVFVAATGNEDQAKPLPPAGIDEVVTVTAGSDQGVRCLFAQQSLHASLQGPGCSDQVVDGAYAWPAGSSAATASVAAYIAALRARQPSATGQEIRDNVLSVPGGLFDGNSGRSWFQSEDLDPVPSDEPTRPGSVLSVSGNSSAEFPIVPEVVQAPSLRIELWRPRVRARQRGSRLVVRRMDRGPRGTLVVRVYSRRNQAIVERRSKSTSVTIRLVGKGRAVECWVERGAPPTSRSLTRRAKVSRL